MKSKPSPVKGQKLYRFWGGLQTATFIEESIVEGASTPTWLVRDDLKPTRCIRCGVDSWFLTEAEAIRDEIESNKSGITNAKECIANSRRALSSYRADINKLRARLAEL